jgi:isoleucyl-tRNA synthetase
VASDGGETVAVAVTITPDLRREGLARDTVRLIQDARRADGLEITDRVVLRWSSDDPDVAAALAVHADLIAAEVLAIDFAELRPEAADAGGIKHESAEPSLVFWLQRAPGPEISRPQPLAQP